MMDHRCRHFRDQASQFQWWLHTWCLRAEKVSQGDVNRGYIRNTAQAIFASLSHDHKYHLNGLAIGRACHFPICSRTWPPSVAWHFPNAQWGPNLHENYGPPGLLASPGHGKGLWSLCFVPCWTWTPPSANSPPSPTVAAGRKKILIYGESMVNLYGESLWWISMVNLYGESMTILMGWWFSPLGSRRTPLDPTWWEAQVAMANCNSFRSVVQFCSRLGNESEIWDV